jgi:hypothetical protein
MVQLFETIYQSTSTALQKIRPMADFFCPRGDKRWKIDLKGGL